MSFAPRRFASWARVILGVHPETRAVGVAKTSRAGRGADRSVEPRRAERVEKPRRDAFALHQAHRAGIAVRHDGFGRAGGDRLEPVGG
jgi:hypothetical protein